MRLRELPLARRLLVTWFLVALGAGFVAAQVNLRLQHELADGEPGMTFEDVVTSFHGRPGDSLLTAKVSPGGSMAKHLPNPADRAALRTWVADGAREDAFAPVAEVLGRRCVRCHNPGGEMRHVPFAASREQAPEFRLVRPLAEASGGMSWAALARSSHAHLFGLATLFAVAGWVFTETSASSRVKAVAVSLPFAALLLDVGSWWLTKIDVRFAVGIVAGGVLMAGAFALLILWPLWDLWVPRRRPAGPGAPVPEPDGD